MKRSDASGLRHSLVLALIAVGVGGCDFLSGQEFSKERADRAYRTAMDDYRAGRLQQAVDGLSKVSMADPANASARFQLACLLQDFSKDYFAASCEYREYLQQQPGSEKAPLAKDRLQACEKELAKTLAAKYRLDTSEGLRQQLDAASSAREEAEKRSAALEKEVAVLKSRLAAVEAGNARLRNAFGAEDGEETAGASVKTALEEAKRLAGNDEKTAESSGLGTIADAKALLKEEEEDGTAPLVQPADARQKRDAAEKAKQTAEAADYGPEHPSSYVVQEGDSLYKIAMRFYGRKSAWSRIRDANKAIISTDGRVKAGQRIVLPK